MSRSTAVLNWLFRSRATGRITIGQFPNLLLSIWLAATAVRWLIRPAGDVREVVAVTATAALALWATDEIVRGVNPWRRSLGTIVLVSIIVAGVT